MDALDRMIRLAMYAVVFLSVAMFFGVGSRPEGFILIGALLVCQAVLFSASEICRRIDLSIRAADRRVSARDLGDFARRL
jgi:Zn-dependent membrane protease YugP